MENFDTSIRQAIFFFLPFLFLMASHDCLKAYLAQLYGDNGPKAEGRMTLNPIPHIHPIFTIILPFSMFLLGLPILIGSTKPMQIATERFNRKNLISFYLWQLLHNFIVGLLFATLLLIQNKTMPWLKSTLPIQDLLVSGVLLSFILGFFQLIPIPPFLLGQIIKTSLPYEQAKTFSKIEDYSLIIIVILLVTKVLHFVIIPGQIIASILIAIATS